jgi:hypothetical protein
VQLPPLSVASLWSGRLSRAAPMTAVAHAIPAGESGLAEANQMRRVGGGGSARCRSTRAQTGVRDS